MRAKAPVSCLNNQRYRLPDPCAPLQGPFSQSRGTFLPIVRQLHVLGLGEFEGRQHCGMDVRIQIMPGLDTVRSRLTTNRIRATSLGSSLSSPGAACR